MLESHLKEASRPNQLYDIEFRLESFPSLVHRYQLSILSAAHQLARQTIVKENLLDAVSLCGFKRGSLKLVELGDQIIVEVVTVQNAENQSNDCDQNPLKAANV